MPPWQCRNIEATQGFEVIAPAGEVIFEALDGIRLGSGFRIGVGGRFTASISGQ